MYEKVLTELLSVIPNRSNVMELRKKIFFELWMLGFTPEFKEQNWFQVNRIDSEKTSL